MKIFVRQLVGETLDVSHSGNTSVEEEKVECLHLLPFDKIGLSDECFQTKSKHSPAYEDVVD